MPARIIETNTTPFNRVAVDPITLDIVENALRNARNEMDAVLFRTAMSPGIREQHDAFPMIANHEGKMVVGQFGSFLYGFIAGSRPGGDFATFVDGHNEIAICDAVLKSSRERRWVDVEY